MEKTKSAKKKSNIITPDSSAQQGEFKIIPIGHIDPSPFNHRKIFRAAEMTELAASIALHGIIENLVVRLMPSGRFELVSGERRLRAAKIAKLNEVPAMIRELSDDQVREIQLAENLQREDPHPLEDAETIGELQKKYKTLDEVALRMGKSGGFVHGRLKLLTLIPDIREMFAAEKFTLQQVLGIAALSPDSQQEFYTEYCSDWRDEEYENFDPAEVLDRFRYDLTEAPFNPKDKKLLPDQGACTSCPYNTATLTSLFPEEEKQSVCTNTGCYHRKCNAHFTIGLRAALLEHQPAALLFYGNPSPLSKTIIAGLPEAAALPQYNYHGVTIPREPVRPDPDDYTLEMDEPSREEVVQVPDTEGYALAMEEYNTEMEEFRDLTEKGELLKGLLITDRQYRAHLFSPESPIGSAPAKSSVTAAQVQAAIKSGEVTPELLQAEITRIQTREERTQELDVEKVHTRVLETFRTQIAEPASNGSLTDADRVAVRLLIFQSLDYSATDKVRKALVLSQGSDQPRSKENFYDQLSQLTDAEFAYLVRMALAGKSDAQYPHTMTGYFLYRVAAESGVDTASIQLAQSQTATSRQQKQRDRIAALQKKIEDMQIPA